MPPRFAASEQSQRPSSGSEGSSEPEPFNPSDHDIRGFKNALEHIFFTAKPSGSFATFGTTQYAPLCGLSVHGLGPIGLPLTVRDAQLIKAVCHRLPFGKGSETVVDESVGKRWELNPDQFNLFNPNWTNYVSDLTSKVIKALRCPVEMLAKASLYKLLLYEEGAMFKPHKDTEKERGMFGTLVICLPSVHTGGEVIVSHHGEQKVLQTAIASDFNSTYLSWYADVRHSVEPITSGNRLVLVYNLLQVSQGYLPSSSLLLKEKRRLGRVLAGWNRGITTGAEVPNFLLFQFEHEYTDNHLKIDSLKGLDKVKADYLRETCHENHIGLYLSSMKKSVVGGCEGDEEDHVIEEVIEEKIELKRMFDLDGNVIAQEIAVDEYDIVAEHPYERSCDYEAYGEYTGIAGPSTTQYFHDTVAVLVPFVSRTNWLLESYRHGLIDTNPWMDRLLETKTLDNAAKADIFNLALLMIKLHQKKEKKAIPWFLNRDYISKQFSKPKAGRILKASIKLSSPELFAEGLRLLGTDVEIGKEDFMVVGQGTLLFQVPFHNTCVDSLIARKRTFSDRVVALESLTSPHYPSDRRPNLTDSLMKSDQVSDWRHSKLVEVTELTKTPDRQDGQCLAACLSGLYADRYKHFAEKNQCNTEFTAALIASTIRHSERGRVHGQQVDAILNRFLGSFIQSFSFKVLDPLITKKPDTPGEVMCPSSAKDVAIIFRYLYQTNRTIHIDMVESVNHAFTKPPTAVLDGFTIELLQHLSTSIRQDRSLAAIYATLFRTILVSYVEQHVQHRPPGGDWERSGVGCNRCEACRRLDYFLRDPTQEVGKFALKPAGRVHLHEMLDSTNHKHVTKGKGHQSTEHDEWAKRHAMAQKKMAELDREVLVEMLGKDDVEQLLACQKMRRDVQALESQVKGTKRKRVEREVIDLT